MPNVFEHADGSLYEYDTDTWHPPLAEEEKPGPHVLEDQAANKTGATSQTRRAGGEPAR